MIDLLIAETAIENDLYLLHDDNDFTNMAKVIKELKLYEQIFSYNPLNVSRETFWDAICETCKNK